MVSAYAEVPRAQVPTLFAGTAEYFDEALRQICRVSPEDELSLRRDPDGTIAFEPPRDLTYRFRALPISYLKEQNIIGTADRPGRIRVTFSKELAAKRLKAARDSADSQWPNVSYLTDVHPVLDWLTDKVLVEVGRHEAPVLNADVDRAGLPDPGHLRQCEGPSDHSEMDGGHRTAPDPARGWN